MNTNIRWTTKPSASWRASEHLEQRARIIALYSDFALALARSVSEQVLVQHCVDLLLTHLPIGWVGIWTQEPNRSGLVPQACSTLISAMQGWEFSFPVGAQTVNRVASGSSFTSSLAVSHDMCFTLPERIWAAQQGMNIFAGYPLRTLDAEGIDIVGVLILFAAEPLPDMFLTTLEDIALVLAVAIQRRDL